MKKRIWRNHRVRKRAADWKHFETEKDVYPNLRWMPTTSANPDPVHARFWSQKLTLPVDDPFWDHHHPGEEGTEKVLGYSVIIQ